MIEAMQAYSEALPESRKHRVQKLHDLILECFPEAVVDIQDKMPLITIGRDGLRSQIRMDQGTEPFQHPVPSAESRLVIDPIQT
jgi:hypothetical protein